MALLDIVFPASDSQTLISELGQVTQGLPNDVVTENNDRQGALVVELPKQIIVVTDNKRKVR